MTTGSRRRWLGIAFVVVCLAPAAVSLVETFRDAHRTHHAWLLAAAVGVTLLLIAALTWAMTARRAGRAAALQAEHAGSWVRAMTQGRASYLLYLDSDEIKLIGGLGGVSHRHARSELSNVDIAPVRYPLATRKGLRLEFSDGDAVTLLTSRHGGLASTVPEAQSAIAYLQAGSEGHPPGGPGRSAVPEPGIAPDAGR